MEEKKSRAGKVLALGPPARSARPCAYCRTQPRAPLSMSRSPDDDPESRARRWRVAFMLGPPAVVALVGALSLWGLLAVRERERVARLAARAESRVAALVATASEEENAEREFVLTGLGNASPSPTSIERAVAQDVTEIRAGLDGSATSEAAIDTLAVAT